jgi:FtsZ-binding cell division protein ZapB
MNEKKVILLKTEYDAMEKELSELRAVVDSKTLTKIFVPHSEVMASRHIFNNHFHSPIVGGTIVKYVSGLDNEEVITELAKEVEILKGYRKSLDERDSELDRARYELSKAQDEIKRLSVKWYNKLFKNKS